MVEILSIVFVVFLGVSLYMHENTLHKNKIEFDLLEDRKIQKILK